MSFEPRLFAGDDADADPTKGLSETVAPSAADEFAEGDFKLPDDLVELASQLACDADHLALRYPAGQVARAATSAMPMAVSETDKSDSYRQPAFPWRAAMAFLISGVVIWTASHAMRRHTPAVNDSSHSSASVIGADSRVAIADVGAMNSLVPASNVVPAVADFNSSAASDSLNVFEKLSGAEQEAVLDLMEHQAAAKEVWGI